MNAVLNFLRACVSVLHRRTGPRRWAVWVLACLVVAPLLAVAQAQLQRESAVKAAFLYRFTSFVDWPSTAFTEDEPLVIAVVNDEPVAADLEQMVGGRSAQGRRVNVRRVAEPAGAAGSHLLYIGQRPPQQLRDAIAAVPPGPVLLVTDSGQSHPPGSALNFQREEGRVRFTASPPAAEARGLRLGARLLQVAMAVEPRGP
jgi:hypothetical protein